MTLYAKFYGSTYEDCVYKVDLFSVDRIVLDTRFEYDCENDVYAVVVEYSILNK